ncbi:proton-conducting transporter membrane subunit [Streptomyces sp. YIM 98790]|uniref:proton-conducting transporter transmembrane domain-containing protein n=1 Tax=Streptomyces sp. YIM 98790 TaxID=2689077 RepID=UPI001A9D80D9|nr:proton-conducting transporter membrane subunit [Streptomyces sp. YIM 98790]
MTQAMLLAAVALPAATAAAGSARRLRDLAPGLNAGAALLCVASACGLAVTVAFHGPVEAVLARSDGQAWTGLVADRVTAVVLLLVYGVSAVVQVFARRYLHGDLAAARFATAAGALTAATAAMVTAATLVTLAVAWSLTGWALYRLVGVYRPAPSAADAARRTGRAVLAGDVALWAAVGLAVAVWGDTDLRRHSPLPADLAGGVPGGVPAAGATGTVVACLLVVAAAARCAQLPWHRWLGASLAAPTPVSALLHAGVVNAGGILLVRMSPVFGAAPVATHLAFAIGAVSTVAATAVMLARFDVKGALVHSTVGQMGFMLMTCALGLYAAAVVHLFAHGLFKAALFLGSGSAVQQHARRALAPPAPRLSPAGTTGIAVLSVAAALAAVAAAVWWLPPHTAGAALLVFAAATAARLAWGWLRHHPTAGGLAALVIVLPAAAAGYLALVKAVTAFFAPALPATAPGAVPAWLLGAVVAVLAAGTLLPRVAPALGAGHWYGRLYALALSAGQQHPRAFPGDRPPHPVPVPQPHLPRSGAARQ